jgi:phosphatidylglycerol---prolipoprotein diacylglyceryl transferase
MRRILFQWRGFQVYSYPAMLYLGLVCGIIAGNYAANLARLNSARVFIATLLLLIPALAGARLLFVATHWEVYRRAPERIWRRSEGGAALYGGVPFMLLASVPLLAALEIPLGAFWDVATFTILIGMIFTRFGCLLNGCCGGRATDGPIALYLPDYVGNWQRRIPTQLLEAGWAGLLLMGAMALWNHLPFPGAIFLYALAGYGVGRFVFESTRAEQDRLGKLTLHRLISLLLVVGALVTFLLTWAR